MLIFRVSTLITDKVQTIALRQTIDLWGAVAGYRLLRHSTQNNMCFRIVPLPFLKVSARKNILVAHGCDHVCLSVAMVCVGSVILAQCIN